MTKAHGRSVIERAVSSALSMQERVVLAVSGGRDSMVMLEALAATAPERIAAVATFNHGTGPAATAAADHVVQRARELGIPSALGIAGDYLRGEAALRAARWTFLGSVGAANKSPIATAHTRDDQVETVFMRALRNAGARGLAGMYSSNGILRPLLSASRSQVARYAADNDVRWIEDPSNTSPRYLRNRVRRDLLPALAKARPGLAAELLALAGRAAVLRGDIDAFLDGYVEFSVGRDEMAIPRKGLIAYDEGQLELLWPALASRYGAVLDRRGTRRLSAFTIHGVSGARIQLSGGYEVLLHREMLTLRRSEKANNESGVAPRDALPLVESLVVGEWRIRRRNGVGGLTGWVAALPSDLPLTARLWRPGDRMVPAGAVSPRRIKGLLRDAGIDAGLRARWPVVLSGEEIVWVPGVRFKRTDWREKPATVYECEYVGG